MKKVVGIESSQRKKSEWNYVCYQDGKIIDGGWREDVKL